MLSPSPPLSAPRCNAYTRSRRSAASRSRRVRGWGVAMPGVAGVEPAAYHPSAESVCLVVVAVRPVRRALEKESKNEKKKRILHLVASLPGSRSPGIERDIPTGARHRRETCVRGARPQRAVECAYI